MASAQQRLQDFLNKYPTISFSEIETALSRQFPDWRNDPLLALAAKNNLDPKMPQIPQQILNLFLYVRNVNRAVYEAVEGKLFFEPKAWTKTDEMGNTSGGGTISGARGEVIEKVAVNMSVVWGPQYPSTEAEHAGKPFTAGGVSLICHPTNPFAPIVHMNIRYIAVGHRGEEKIWIGGGADLTPMEKFEDDTRDFHAAFKKVCDENTLGDHAKFKAWCDEYFFIKHRNEPRGVGGIFFDYLPLTQLEDSQILLHVGQALARTYGDILARRVEMPYGESEKSRQLFWRGRYVEFNLLYDRGTRFGLLSGGNIEAIFSSLPPLVKW